jgi:serine/threonine protein kinase
MVCRDCSVSDLVTAQSLLYQLLRGMDYCFSRGIMHRDLKPHNILVSKAGVVKVADFGLARSFAVPHSRKYTTEVFASWCEDVL